MTVRIYSSLDTGAPSIPNVSTRRFIDNMRLVLTACLVNGYSGRAAAGWTVTHDVADGFSLSNGEGVINFVHLDDSNVQVYLMESVSNGSTPLAAGINRRSGPWFDGESTSSRQTIFSYFWGQGSGVKSWVLVADEKTVTVMFQYFVDTVDVTVANRAVALHFGRFYPVVGGVGFCALGGSGLANNGGILWGSGWWGTVLRNPFDNLVNQGSAPFYGVVGRSAMFGSELTSRTRVTPRVVQFVRAGLGCGGVGLSGATTSSVTVYGGALRGLLLEPFLCGIRLSQLLPALGVSSPSFSDRLRALSLGSRSVLPLFPRDDDSGGFVSLDSSDWEPLWT